MMASISGLILTRFQLVSNEEQVSEVRGRVNSPENMINFFSCSQEEPDSTAPVEQQAKELLIEQSEHECRHHGIDTNQCSSSLLETRKSKLPPLTIPPSPCKIHEVLISPTKCCTPYLMLMSHQSHPSKHLKTSYFDKEFRPTFDNLYCLRNMQMLKLWCTC